MGNAVKEVGLRQMEIKKKTNFGNEKGVSVLEVLIVIVIGAVLVGVALSQFGNSKMQLQRQNVAREFKNNLERARFDSVRRRIDDDDYTNMSQIIINSATSYEVRIDSNQDGIISTAEVRTVNFAQNSDAKILHANAAYPIIIRFNRRGHITTNSSGVSVNPLFTVCSGVCTAATTITPANGNVISISPTGTVAMLYGGDEIPPLAAPNISNVGNSSNINFWITVSTTPTPVSTPVTTPTATPVGGGNTNSNPNPTPTPTAIPSTPTPTPPPVSTPTPEPTPVPTTPTPTPVQLLECPGNNTIVGNPPTCICSAPRRIKANGKCQP